MIFDYWSLNYDNFVCKKHANTQKLDYINDIEKQV